jgi:hypothetical protein
MAHPWLINGGSRLDDIFMRDGLKSAHARRESPPESACRTGRFVAGGTMDLFYVALAGGLFGLAWGLVKICESV